MDSAFLPFNYSTHFLMLKIGIAHVALREFNQNSLYLILRVN